MRYVYVLDRNGEPLMPTCRYGKVRRMLKSGQAKAVDTLPFTIQLSIRKPGSPQQKISKREEKVHARNKTAHKYRARSIRFCET